MIIQKKIKVIILSVVLSVMLNVGYFKTLNHESYLNIIGKAVSINYLSFEPIIQRGRLVKNFDIQCKKTDCLPFVKNKNSQRIKFIKELQEILKKDSSSVVFVSMFMVDDFFNDLRFYIQNPIYIDTKVLGISYYSKYSFFEEYKKRFSLAYNYHYCNESLKHNQNKSRIKYLNNLFEILNLEVSCKNKQFNELKAQKIKYIIDKKKYLIKNKIIFCEEEFCLAIL